MTGDRENGQETSNAEKKQGHNHKASSMGEAARKLAREAMGRGKEEIEELTAT
jgi:hypothetical protein